MTAFQSAHRLLKDPKSASTSPSRTNTPQHLEALLQIAQEQLAKADAVEKDEVLKALPKAWSSEAAKWIS
jgi:hypothetical protein